MYEYLNKLNKEKSTMKTIFKITALTAIMLLMLGNVSAQKYKFGHLDSQGLLVSLPETATAKKTLEAEKKKIETRLLAMQTESQEKYKLYMENEQLAAASPEKWSALEKRDKEAEIQSLQQRMQTFQASAEQELAKKQSELYEPILKKVDDAIKAVAAEGKFTYLFDVNAVLYFSPTQSIDVTSLVKKKLGITE